MFRKSLILAFSLATAGFAQSASYVCGAEAPATGPITMTLTFVPAASAAAATTPAAPPAEPATATPASNPAASPAATTTATAPAGPPPPPVAPTPAAVPASATTPATVPNNPAGNPTAPSPTVEPTTAPTAATTPAAATSSTASTPVVTPTVLTVASVSAASGSPTAPPASVTASVAPTASISGVQFLGGSSNCYTYRITGKGFGDAAPATVNGLQPVMIGTVVPACFALNASVGSACTANFNVPVPQVFQIVSWSDSSILVDAQKDLSPSTSNSTPILVDLNLPNAQQSASYCWTAPGGRSCALQSN